MRVVLACLLAAVASADGKMCLGDWARDTRDSCALYAELADCQAQAAMCAPQDLVYVKDMQNKVHALMLAEQTFAALNAAVVTLVNANEAGVEISFETTYAGSAVTFRVENDDDLKKAMSVKQDGVYTAEYVVGEGWIEVGTLNDWETVQADYTPDQYKYGVLYNHGGALVVHEVTPSSWNRGIRLMTEEYMQGDNVNDFEIGVAVFFKGLHDAANWTHRYYQHRDGTFKNQWSNGASGGVRLFVHKLPNPWIHAGTLSNWDTILGTYPTSQYRYGMRYNSIGNFVHDVAISGWNRGVRLTTEPYMMGDTGSTLDYGRTTFSRGTDNQSHTWEHHYYRLRDGAYVEFHSNGSIDNGAVYVKKIV